jgi:hypothetical protein
MTDNRPFEGTSLWKRTLAAQHQGDVHEKARLRLRAAYEAMRRNAATITAQIQKDFPFLTLHDINHLDALWTLADLIAGDEFQLTPTEALCSEPEYCFTMPGLLFPLSPAGSPS